MPLALSGNGNIIATSTPGIGGFRGTEIGEVKVYRIMNTPIPPTNLAINADTAFFASLRWQVNSSDEDGFIIRRQQGNGPWAILDYVPADQFWYYDVLAMDGQTYHYTVSGIQRQWGIRRGWACYLSVP